MVAVVPMNLAKDEGSFEVELPDFVTTECSAVPTLLQSVRSAEDGLTVHGSPAGYALVHVQGSGQPAVVPSDDKAAYEITNTVKADWSCDAQSGDVTTKELKLVGYAPASGLMKVRLELGEDAIAIIENMDGDVLHFANLLKIAPDTAEAAVQNFHKECAAAKMTYEGERHGRAFYGKRPLARALTDTAVETCATMAGPLKKRQRTA